MAALTAEGAPVIMKAARGERPDRTEHEGRQGRRHHVDRQLHRAIGAPAPDSVLQVVKHIEVEEGESGPDAGQAKATLELGVCRAGSEATIGQWMVRASSCRHLGGATPVTAVKKAPSQSAPQCKPTDCCDSVIPCAEFGESRAALHTK